MKIHFYMKNILLTAFSLGLLFCFSACKDSPAKTDSAKTISETTDTETQETQALILTQSFDFDPADKNKVTGSYESKSKITVPQNLTPQNKWIMFEGPILENDKIAFRYYADSRHRFDIYGKTVTDLVMDTVSWKYHDIMNWGSDILKVGNSLGSGSPGIWYRDSIYTLSDCESKTIEIIKNQSSESIIQTVFKGLKIEDQKFDLIQNQSIKAGNAWTEVQLELPSGKLPEGMFFATGIVKHLPEIAEGATDQYFYAMNWGKQSFHKENMGMAITAKKDYQPEKVSDELSHVYTFKNAEKEVRYRVVSAWERDVTGVKDESGFKKIVEDAGTR